MIPSPDLSPLGPRGDDSPLRWPRILTGVLVILSMAAVATAPLFLGCATLGANSTARAVVAAAAAPAESLAVSALEAELARLPADPVEFHAWLVGAGLTEDEAHQVEAVALADGRAELAGLVEYIDGGAIGRLALSALAGEKPELVGPREAARYLLARAQVREVPEAVPVSSAPVVVDPAPMAPQ
jgi:hypothetical protein